MEEKEEEEVALPKDVQKSITNRIRHNALQFMTVGVEEALEKISIGLCSRNLRLIGTTQATNSNLSTNRKRCQLKETDESSKMATTSQP